MNEQEPIAEQENPEYEAFLISNGRVAIAHAKGIRLMTPQSCVDELNDLVRQRDAVIKERDTVSACTARLDVIIGKISEILDSARVPDSRVNTRETEDEMLLEERVQWMTEDRAGAIQERDALKRQLESIREAHKNLQSANLYNNLVEAKRQRDQYRSQRDAARAEVEKLKEQILEDQNRCNPYVSLTTQKDLDQVRAEVEKLKAELNKAEKAWLYWENKAKSNSMKLRPEPSRLEIAAMILAGGCANPELATNEDVALAQADALIAAAKEEPSK
jgi:hypothetical protein